MELIVEGAESFGWEAKSVHTGKMITMEQLAGELGFYLFVSATEMIHPKAHLKSRLMGPTCHVLALTFCTS